MWRFRLRVLSSQKSQEIHVVQEVVEVVRVISDEEVDNDRFLRGLLQQNFSLMVLHKYYRREQMVQYLMWEEFLSSNVDC